MNTNGMQQFINNMSALVGSVELIDHVLFDTERMGGIGVDTSFFIRPYSETKDLIDTNMVHNASLPSPQGFWVEGMSIAVLEDKERDLVNALFTMIVGSKPYVTLPALMVLRPQLIAQTHPTMTMHKPSPSIAIPPHANFCAQLRFKKSFATNMLIRVEIHGKLLRPVI